MSSVARFSAALIVATVAAQTAVLAQGLEVRRYNPSEWTKGRFSEVVTVNGPGKTIYLAGIGAAMLASLDRTLVDVVVDTGQEPANEGYSAFQETNLDALLREQHVDHLTVVGLATEYCVYHTVMDALRGGFGVTVDSTGIRGIDVQPGDSDRALAEMRTAGASIA